MPSGDSRIRMKVLRCFVPLALFVFSSCTGKDGNTDTCDNPNGMETAIEETSDLRIPEGCNLVMAKSAIQDAGWGVFSLSGLNRGDVVAR
eukprot:scaffold16330_cov102-Cylindrotheca_fusiformis.AAC.1